MNCKIAMVTVLSILLLGGCGSSDKQNVSIASESDGLPDSEFVYFYYSGYDDQEDE